MYFPESHCPLQDIWMTPSCVNVLYLLNHGWQRCAAEMYDFCISTVIVDKTTKVLPRKLNKSTPTFATVGRASVCS